MLANSLTVEDEEAVQAELRELQLETVCFGNYLDSRHIPQLFAQLGVQDAERPIRLPSVPTEEPVGPVRSKESSRICIVPDADIPRTRDRTSITRRAADPSRSMSHGPYIVTYCLNY